VTDFEIIDRNPVPSTIPGSNQTSTGFCVVVGEIETGKKFNVQYDMARQLIGVIQPLGNPGVLPDYQTAQRIRTFLLGQEILAKQVAI
jgi:hypothetical protein